MDPYKKAATFFRALIPISISIDMIADIVCSPARPPLWVLYASLILLLIAVVGIYVCENRMLGVRTEQERRELWKPHPRIRAMRWAMAAIVVVLAGIVLFR